MVDTLKVTLKQLLTAFQPFGMKMIYGITPLS